MDITFCAKEWSLSSHGNSNKQNLIRTYAKHLDDILESHLQITFLLSPIRLIYTYFMYTIDL